ncbi:MAG: hypothetical protein AAFO69_21785, partial [Bacteroidota bacterium]
QNATSVGDLLVKDTRKVYRKPVSFELYNNTEEPILVASTYHLFIEVYRDEYSLWERLPYKPCNCNSPCASPAVVNLEAGTSIPIVWDRNRVSCSGQQAEGEKPTDQVFQEKGLYRMKFRYTPIESGRKMDSKDLVFEFRLR